MNENMKTVNVISTPNIQGNIGSCETKAVETSIGKGLIVETFQVIETNSCTGEIVSQYQYEDRSAYIPAFMVVFLILIVGILIIKD